MLILKNSYVCLQFRPIIIYPSALRLASRKLTRLVTEKIFVAKDKEQSRRSLKKPKETRDFSSDINPWSVNDVSRPQKFSISI